MRYHIKQAGNEVRDSGTAAILQSQLAQQEAELDARRRLLKHEIAHESRDGRDSAEYSADQSAFGVNASLLEVTARTRRNIEDALERIRSESFGRCLNCDTSIPMARLEALPFAERCRDCQEHRDEEALREAEARYRPL